MERFGAESVARHRTLEHATSMAAIAAGVHGTTPGGDDVAALLSVAPDDVARSLVSADRTRANLVFPITNIPLQARERLATSSSGSSRANWLHPLVSLRQPPASRPSASSW